MKSDPLVEEVHRTREAIATRFGGDLRAIAEDAERRQAASGRKTSRCPPRRRAGSPAKAG